MPRKKLIRCSNSPYHITIRCNHQFWFEIPLEVVWKICLKALLQAKEERNLELHAFVLMNNHYHLIASTPDSNIDKAMRDINKFISDKIYEYSGMPNRKFGGPYRWSIIDRKEYLVNVYRYVYQNPLKAKLSKSCENYPFSSINIPEIFEPHIEYDEAFSTFCNRFNQNDDNAINAGLRCAFGNMT